MKTLNLVVPGLCGPLPGLETLQNDATLSAVGKLLSRADRLQCKHNGFYPELAALFGFRPVTTIPSAVLSLLGHDHEPGQGYWFHADPVYLQADMDRAILRDSSNIDLTKQEADALTEEVNQHFSEDGIRVFAVDADHWFLNISKYTQVETTSLHDVIGCNINFHMPEGKDASFWKGFLNEVQMLFHISKVNQTRERSGLLPVNSMWLWGGGILPDVIDQYKHRVYSDHPYAKGLASIYDSVHQPVDAADSLFDVMSDKETFIVIYDDVFKPACYGDVDAWKASLEEIFESKVFSLISKAMHHKVPVRLYPCNGISYLISPGNKYRFYRRGNIRDHIGTYVTT